MIPLSVDQEYFHLGVTTEFKANKTLEQDIANKREDLCSIDGCFVAPSQKLNAVRTFVLKRMFFILRGAKVIEATLTEFNKGIKRVVQMVSPATVG